MAAQSIVKELVGRNGILFERLVEAMALDKGFKVVPYKEWKKNGGEGDAFIKNHPYHKDGGFKGYAEFVLHAPSYGVRTRIECKYQSTTGTADEKLFPMYMNCISRDYDFDTTVIIVQGEGFRKAMVDHLRMCAVTKRFTDSQFADPDKKVMVFNIDEFIDWFAGLEKIQKVKPPVNCVQYRAAGA